MIDNIISRGTWQFTTVHELTVEYSVDELCGYNLFGIPQYREIKVTRTFYGCSKVEAKKHAKNTLQWALDRREVYKSHRHSEWKSSKGRV